MYNIFDIRYCNYQIDDNSKQAEKRQTEGLALPSSSIYLIVLLMDMDIGSDQNCSTECQATGQ